MSARRVPPPTVLAIRELLRPYLPDLDEREIVRRLSAPADPAPTVAPSERLLTVPEAARVLRVCPMTVYNLFAAGKLARVKVLGATRIRLSELEALTAGRPAAAESGVVS